MLDGVERFLNERSSQHVTHVNIVILHVHQETFRVFRDVIIGKSDMNKGMCNYQGKMVSCVIIIMFIDNLLLTNTIINYINTAIICLRIQF